MLGIRKGDLESNYLGYILALSSYEDDSAILHYLNPVTWYTIAAAFYSAVGDGIACVFGGGAKSCYDAVCDLLTAVAELGAFITSVEDDLLGTAAGRFTKTNSGDQSVFGLLPGENSRDVSVQGSMNPNNNLWMELKRITDAACSGTYAAVKYLMQLAVGTEDQDPWTKADMQIDLLPVRSNIQQIDVQFKRVNVINDREGFGRGDGDMYVYTTVGTLGDPGSASGQTGGTATRLPTDKLQALPMRAVDVMRLPQSGERGIGDNGSWSPNARIFSNSWLNTEFVAGLYVQIVMFDADNFEDDEVGIISDYYAFDTLWQFVSWCAQGNVPGYVRDFGTDQCKATVTKNVSTRVYLKDDGKQGIWGNVGATFTYEIQITPTNWP